MILIQLNKQDFEYDLHSLVKSFYPGEDVTVCYEEPENAGEALLKISVIYKEQEIAVRFEKDGQVVKEDTEAVEYEKNRKETKNHLKYRVYRMLSDYTGTTLPWGTLTGIRPTKIPMALLEQGMSNRDIADYMRKTYLISPAKTSLGISIANRERHILRDIDYDNGYSLYVGIPFCPSICLYCSFSSSPLSVWKKKVDDYLDALCKEIAYGAEIYKERQLDTVYIGGGTPTTLEPEQLDRLLTEIKRHFDLSKVQEFTVEAGRPDCTDEEKLRIIKEYGATRISINPQTFSDEVLRNIGRRHTAQDILDCYRTARRVGHDNINMDLIAGLPGDTVEGFRHSLQTAIDLDPENITVHTLTLKRASNLVVEHRAADYADVAAMVESCELLEKAGYRPYYLYRQKGTLQNLENVGWCKPGYECLYNIYIMEEVHTILSAGAGGSTKLVAPGARHGKIERIFNYKYPTEYIDRFDTILARKEGVKQFYDQYPSCGESARPQAHGGV